MTRRTRRLGLSLAAIALAGALSGCKDESATDQTPSGATAAPTSTEPSDGETEPTGAPSSSEFTDGPTRDPSGSPASRARAAAITADELPGLNDNWTWRVESQGPGPGQSPPSLCTLSSMGSIGAFAEYRTDYDSRLSKTAHASVITAVFPDAQTATLAKTVLRSWHDGCTKRLRKVLGYTRVDVSPISIVSTNVGPAQSWLSIYGPVNNNPDAGWFQGEGFVVDGDTMTYAVIASVGQDYNYDEGGQPVQLALQTAGAKLEQTR